MIINDRAYQSFCLGTYHAPVGKPLTGQQQRVFDALQKCGSYQAAADYLRVELYTIHNAVTLIKSKGWSC